MQIQQNAQEDRRSGFAVNEDPTWYEKFAQKGAESGELASTGGIHLKIWEWMRGDMTLITAILLLLTIMKDVRAVMRSCRMLRRWLAVENAI